MIKIVEELKKWREDRNMQDNEFVVEIEVASMLDECKEVLLAKTDEHKAEEYCDNAIFAFNGLGLLNLQYERHIVKFGDIAIITECLSAILGKPFSHNGIGYELNDIIEACKMAVEKLGYDFEKMMIEKIKVLHSRIQSPTQARDWAENGASGKWQKSTFAEHMAMVYKPDFESCRLKK